MDFNIDEDQAAIADMASLTGHDPCSAVPWVFGDEPKAPAFHPNLVGAEATAREVLKVISG